MDETWPIFIALGFLAAIPILLIFRVILSYKKRRTAWQLEAEKLGFQWMEDASGLAVTHWKLKIFSVRGMKVFQNSISGKVDETRATLCDYVYSAHEKAMSAPEQTIALFCDNRLRLPHFILRPRSLIWDNIGKLFESGEVTFPDDVPFTNSFFLEGDVKVLVRSLFTDELRRQLTSMNLTSYYLEGEDKVLLFHPGHYIDPSNSKELLKLGFSILNTMVKICDNENLP